VFISFNDEQAMEKSKEILGKKPAAKAMFQSTRSFFQPSWGMPQPTWRSIRQLWCPSFRQPKGMKTPETQSRRPQLSSPTTILVTWSYSSSLERLEMLHLKQNGPCFSLTSSALCRKLTLTAKSSVVSNASTTGIKPPYAEWEMKDAGSALVIVVSPKPSANHFVALSNKSAPD
jgi:hypothetical protein